MRYAKGAIDISSEQDQRLLEQVLQSQFITHGQLWEFLRDRCYEMSRGSFCWRAKRLVAHGLLVERVLPSATAAKIYALGEPGIAALQSHSGTFYADHPRVIGKRSSHPHVHHAVTLNDIRLRLLRAGVLDEWLSETEIRSRNEFTARTYRKDYDAIVTLRIGGTRLQFGFEYEGSAKSAARYHALARTLDSETRISAFLYLTASEHLRSLLMQCFHAKSSRPIFAGLYQDLRRPEPLYLPLVDCTSWRTTTLAQLAALLP